MNTPTATVGHEVTRFTFAMDLIDDEMNKLHCLAIALENQLRPNDPKNPTDTDNLIAWRLAEVLEEKLGSTAFEKGVRSLLILESDCTKTQTNANKAGAQE
jgi:hypothetical protein